MQGVKKRKSSSSKESLPSSQVDPSSSTSSPTANPDTLPTGFNDSSSNDMSLSLLLRLGVLLVGVIAVCYAAVELQQHGPSYANILDNDEDDAQVKAPGMTVAWNPSGRSFDMTYESLQGQKLFGRLGAVTDIPGSLDPPQQCDVSGLCWQFGNQAEASLKLTPKAGQPLCYDVEWKSRYGFLQDCIRLDAAHWYGGGEVWQQGWPLEGDENLLGVGGKPELPYVTGDFFSGVYGGVMEPYWINSNGFSLYALRENPLFVKWNASGDQELCLSSRYESPYPLKEEQGTSELSLRYAICSASDVKTVHLNNLAQGLWAKPRGIPDERVFTHPIWSTWAKYKTAVSESRVFDFANSIRQYGFQDSQLEIDDRWETCYGDFTFDDRKFPDPKAMVDQLHSQGFRVTLWIHPFINEECAKFQEAGPHLVKNGTGQPGITRWWQGSRAGIFDFTVKEHADWWSQRVESIRTDFGFDGFKIDAGETNWLPPDFTFTGQLAPNATPNGFSVAYVKNMEQFGGITEVRTGYNAQDVPIFTRMLDKETLWGKANGLATLIPTMLHFGLEGYVFVLPDMIAGNGYNTPLGPGRELFVRWMEANVFMPTMQFSYPPWDYDDEVVNISRRMVDLHAQYAPTIIQLAREATTNGRPINRPLWWIDPTDPETFTIDSEFTLGDDILVAPVLTEGALARDIYLPRGSWRDEVDPGKPVRTGPLWLRNYPAPLDVLPYFTRVV